MTATLFFSVLQEPTDNLKLTNSCIQIIAVLHKKFFRGVRIRNLIVLGQVSLKRKISILWLNGIKLISLILIP